MKRTVSVLISGRQSGTENGAEEIRTEADGHYCLRGGIHYVQYEENPEGVDVPTSTLLKIEPERLTMTKKGPLRARMEFVPDKRTTSQYQTPYGTLSLEVFTRKLAVDAGEGRLCAFVQYRLETDGVCLSENELEITVSM